MKTCNFTLRLLALAAVAMLTSASVNADLISQFGILDLTANGGINPNTGVAWADGDQYRLAFHTAGTINAQSNDPGVYDAFATAQAQQNAALAASTGWTALVWVNTNGALNQAADFGAIGAGESPLSSPLVRAGLDDWTDGSVQGGAGVPVYAMNGTTSIARNNRDIYDNWSNPFDSDAVVRLAAGSFNLDSDGNLVEASQNVHYSPFLDQFGLGDTANIHGPTNWTGGEETPVNPLGDTLNELRANNGNSNANATSRVWNRFQADTDATLGVYAISAPLTVTTAIPEPGSLVMLGLGGALMLVPRRRR